MEKLDFKEIFLEKDIRDGSFFPNHTSIETSSWTESIPNKKKFKELKENKELKGLWELTKSVDNHKKCKSCYKEGRVSALFCRFILEFICQFLLIKKSKLTLKDIKLKYERDKNIQKCNKMEEVFYLLPLEKVIEILIAQKVIGVKNKRSVRIKNLIKVVQDDTGDALHLKINTKYGILDKFYEEESIKILDQTSNLILEFLTYLSS